MSQPLKRRYFTIASGIDNCQYNTTTWMWEVPFPEDFYLSTHPNKHVVVLGVYYWGNISQADSNDWVGFHSPTLCNGKPSDINYFITLSQYPASNWSKEYPISTQEKILQFDFRFRSKAFKKDYYSREIIDQFIIEMELFY